MTPFLRPPAGLVRFLVRGTVVIVAALALVAGATWMGRQVGDRFGGASGPSTTVAPGLDVQVTVPRGASAAEIGQLLQQAGVVSSASAFQQAVSQAQADQSLQAGTYQLVTGMSAADVIVTLTRGPTVETYDVTIREGLRVSEILDVLSQASGIPVAEFEKTLTQGQVTTGLRTMPDKPTLADWEGLLFPDTYRFSKDAAASDILTRMARTMEQRMDEIDWSNLEAAGLTRYQGIIIASLIEAEVRVPEERPLVSSVIRNRLDVKMPLQIDAAVLYALGTRDASKFDSSVDSPYNTYAHTGLPPTPIGAPGRASLEAAAAPADTKYLYYVLSSKDGHHTFSETFAEHQKAVAKAKADGVIP